MVRLAEGPLLGELGHRPAERSARPHNLKLLRVVLVEEGDGYAHRAGVIDGDFGVRRHFDRVVVDVLRVPLRRVGLVEDQLLMPLCDVEVGEPAGVSKAAPVRAVLVAPASPLAHLIMIGDDESDGGRIAEPQLVAPDEVENLFVADRVLVPDNQEPLVVFDQLLDVLAEQRERRVGDDDVRLLEQLHAFRADENRRRPSVRAA